jgi:chromosome segregation ATPase
MLIEQISPEIIARIEAAAEQLYEQSGRADYPKVDAVRRLAKVNMNDASAVMKEWRQKKSAAPTVATAAIPDKVLQTSRAAVASIWAVAQELANEGLKAAQGAWEVERVESEKLRLELAAACDSQVQELDVANQKIGELSTNLAEQERQLRELRMQLAEMTDRAHTAEARVVEIEKRATDLKTELERAHSDHDEQKKRAAQETHRLAERMTKAAAERDQAFKDAQEAMLKAASLQATNETLKSQNASLMNKIGTAK